jgi:HD-GYP domain-containing protein (c-di-GMP phosphodiesterase class II)
VRKLSIDQIKDGMKVSKTVYSSDGLKLIAAGTYLNKKLIRRLKFLGIPAVYIDDGLMNDVEVEDIIRDEIRVETIKLVKKSFDFKQKVGQKIIIDDQSLVKNIEDIIDEIISKGKTVVNLIDIRKFDDYTFAHSVNVCVLAVLTGCSLGYSKSKLTLLGMGALLHDVGKIKVPSRVLNKPGKLDRDEFEMVKRHSVDGYEILKNNKDFNNIVAEVAYQHHERYLGQGYPEGLKKDEIHEFSKITGIVDVYDAITADRIYRKAYAPHEAYEMMAGQGNNLFDFNILKSFLDNVAVYPVGTFVRLNTGEVAGVVKVIRGLTQRPVVRIYFNENGIAIKDPFEIDLSEKLNITIVDVIKEEEMEKLKLNVKNNSN